jgi:hypothetical protein
MREGADKTIFVKKLGINFIIVQVYVDDIVFGSISKHMSQDFVELIQTDFEMSMVGDLTFFFYLQIKQMKDGIFISQTKYANNLVKQFNMKNPKSIRTHISTSQKLSKDEKGQDVDQHLYRMLEICPKRQRNSIKMYILQ